MKKLGQHFLTNPEIVDRIIGAIDIRPQETIVEIGPGHGELSEALIKRFDDRSSMIEARKKINNTHQKLMLIEKDKKLVTLLQAKFKSDPQVEVIEGDALKVLPALVSSLSHVIPAKAGIQKPNLMLDPRVKPEDDKLNEGSPFSIIGNIPYYITGHLFRVLSELAQKPRTTVLMIQEEVAERLIAAPPAMNRLAASVQWWATPRLLFRVPAGAFNPPPQVDSAVISLMPLKRKIRLEDNDYYKTVRLLFAQPRKTILNNLVNGMRIEKEEALSILKNIAINPEDRPQNLSIGQITAIAKKLSN